VTKEGDGDQWRRRGKQHEPFVATLSSTAPLPSRRDLRADMGGARSSRGSILGPGRVGTNGMKQMLCGYRRIRSGGGGGDLWSNDNCFDNAPIPAARHERRPDPVATAVLTVQSASDISLILASGDPPVRIFPSNAARCRFRSRSFWADGSPPRTMRRRIPGSRRAFFRPAAYGDGRRSTRPTRACRCRL